MRSAHLQHNRRNQTLCHSGISWHNTDPTMWRATFVCMAATPHLIPQSRSGPGRCLQSSYPNHLVSGESARSKRSQWNQWPDRRSEMLVLLSSKRSKGRPPRSRMRHLDAPLVIAAKAMDSFFQIRHDAMPALLGRLEPTHPHNPALIALGAPRQSPGVWIGKDGHHRYKNLHAVWLFEAMPSCSPSPTAELDSVLALNPTIAAELPSPLLRVPHMRERDGKMERTDGDDLDQLLGAKRLPRERWEDIPQSDHGSTG